MCKINIVLSTAEDGSTLITTLQEISFKGNDGKLYTIPPGFDSDGASVPRFLWRLLSPPVDSVTLEPSIIHDYEYAKGIGTRSGADKAYYNRLRGNGYPAYKAMLTLTGLKLFGASHWGGKK